MRIRRRNDGGVLVAALVTTVVAAGLAWSTLTFTTEDQANSAREMQDLEARAVAEAGIHRAMSVVRSTLRVNPFDPMGALDRVLFVKGDPTQPQTVTVANDEAVAGKGRTYGSFTVVMTAVANGTNRDITITATGYIPDRATARSKSTTQATVRAALRPAEVFDYSYFINNWGWFYGDTINAYGNVRSNAQFDADNYAPGIFGTPRYTSIDLANPLLPKLVGYQDDNADGVTDGSDGGVFAGWDIVNVGKVRGMGGKSANQHDFTTQIPMPNLNDLTTYETAAKAANSSIKIGGGVDKFGKPLPPIPVCNAVLGDEKGELQNVVLIGTAAQPIIINGPVVVRGDVIIKGVVTGEGAIYSGRNVYVADNLSYANAPKSWVPANESTAATETWLASNPNKDFLGLFAKEQVALGDFTDATWRKYVGWWLSDPMNQSAEDAGADGLPGTRYGRDGIKGTADDDTLEGDGIFTTEKYTQAQADLGLIPKGKKVGDVIPGTGEDIDGDGAFDKTTTLTDFDLVAKLDSGLWAGNLPKGTTSFNQISSVKMSNVDACVYTNHACGMLTLDSKDKFSWHGAIVSRNESLIYATTSMDMYYDRRLTGGGVFGNMLPRTVAPLRVLSWTEIRNDARVQTQDDATGIADSYVPLK